MRGTDVYQPALAGRDARPAPVAVGCGAAIEPLAAMAGAAGLLKQAAVLLPRYVAGGEGRCTHKAAGMGMGAVLGRGPS